MNKQTRNNLSSIITLILILIFVQVIIIRYVAVPVVKKAVIDTFNENGIMCGYDESKDSTEE